jgi:hypothetical protein
MRGGRKWSSSAQTEQGMMRWLMSMAILLPLAVGGIPQRAEPNYPKLENCPFPVDPNLVVGKLLGWVRIELGKTLIHTRTWRDPNGDPAEVKILRGPPGVRILNRHEITSYTVIWTSRQIMTTAIVVQVTDRPATGEPKSDTGTILIQVVPRRLAPRGCGGPPQ